MANDDPTETLLNNMRTQEVDLGGDESSQDSMTESSQNESSSDSQDEKTESDQDEEQSSWPSLEPIPVQDDLEKQQINPYLRGDVVRTLETAWAKMRAQSGEKVYKSSIVEAALINALREYDERGTESLLYRQIMELQK